MSCNYNVSQATGDELDSGVSSENASEIIKEIFTSRPSLKRKVVDSDIDPSAKRPCYFTRNILDLTIRPTCRVFNDVENTIETNYDECQLLSKYIEINSDTLHKNDPIRTLGEHYVLSMVSFSVHLSRKLPARNSRITRGKSF